MRYETCSISADISYTTLTANVDIYFRDADGKLKKEERHRGITQAQLKNLVKKLEGDNWKVERKEVGREYENYQLTRPV